MGNKLEECYVFFKYHFNKEAFYWTAVGLDLFYGTECWAKKKWNTKVHVAEMQC